MPDLFQFVNSTTSSIETGIITDVFENNKYKVRIKNNDFTLVSAITETLTIGDRVIINRDNYRRYIVGSTKRFRSEKETMKEIIVDG